MATVGIWFVAGMLGAATVAAEPQRSITWVEPMPRLPQPLNVIDWREAAVAYTKLIFDPAASGRNLPAVGLSADRRHFAFDGYLAAGRDPHQTNGEAMACLAPVIAAELLGLDMHRVPYQGVDWVSDCLRWYDPAGLWRNRPGDRGGELGHVIYTWWPAALGAMLASRHADDPRFAAALAGQDELLLRAARALGCPGQADLRHAVSIPDLRLSPLPVDGSVGNASSLAWLLYTAFLRNGRREYLDCARAALQWHIDHPGRYEVSHVMGPLAVARLNAEQGADLDLDAMLAIWGGDSPGAAPGDSRWAITRGAKPGGLDCDGVDCDSLHPERFLYAFAMGSYQAPAWLLPVARYDQRYARAIGRYALNAANSCRFFLGIDLDADHQDHKGWRDSLPNGAGYLFSYEGLRTQAHRDDDAHRAQPYATGDPLSGFLRGPDRQPIYPDSPEGRAKYWRDKAEPPVRFADNSQNISLYMGNHIGFLGAVFNATSDPAIIAWDLRATDYSRPDSYPTWLLYNPHDQSRTVRADCLTSASPADWYDAVSGQWLARSVTGAPALNLAADQAMVLVLVPAGSPLSRDGRRLLAAGKVIDYRAAALGPMVDGIDQYDLANRARKVEPFPAFAPEMPAATATVTVHPDQPLGELPASFIGYNLEDLSHELFPGLCAQMIYGESFEDEPDVALPDGWQAHLEPLNEDTPKDPAGQRKWRGCWSFEDGVATLRGSRQRRIWTNAVQIADGTLECEVLQPSTERNWWGPGLLLCWGEKGYYYLNISPERHVVVLCRGTDPRYVQGARTLAWKEAPDLAYDRWHRLTLTRAGARLTVAIDGREMLSANDPEPLPAGGVGLESSSCVSSYRNLVVTPTGQAPWRADFTMAGRPYTHVDHISRWWDPLVTGTARARYAWSQDRPYNTDRCQSLTHLGGEGTVGVINTGLHNAGLSVRAGWRYQGRLYLRGEVAGSVMLALQSRDGVRTYATQQLTGIGAGWKRFDIALAANATDPAARFALWIDRPGRLFVDQVVLMPGDEGLYHGLPIRRDLAEKLVGGVGHLRFGGDMVNVHAFDWREMIKPADQRRQYLDGWNYHKSLLMGIFEFLDLCRVAQVEPVVNLGEHLSANEIAAFVEYCNGARGTAGGQQRAADGHPQSYGLRRVMYGNGLPRIEEVEKLPGLLAAIDPDVKLIIGDLGHVPWVLISRTNPALAARYRAVLPKLEAASSRPEVALLGSAALWDQTMAEAAQGFPELGHGPKLYAEEINGGAYDWQRGLCDALETLASEQRGNLVWGMAFCNGLQANGHLYEWNQGHIHFTPDQSWYQPSGWVVRMMGEAFQPVPLRTESVGPKLSVQHAGEKGNVDVEIPAMAASACRSRDGRTTVLKLVNLWGGPVTVTVDLGQAAGQARVSGITMASRHLAARNTADRPDYLAPKPMLVTAPVNGRLTLALEPVSFSVVRLDAP